MKIERDPAPLLELRRVVETEDPVERMDRFRRWLNEWTQILECIKTVDRAMLAQVSSPAGLLQSIDREVVDTMARALERDGFVIKREDPSAPRNVRRLSYFLLLFRATRRC
jgi:hypothetical protein